MRVRQLTISTLLLPGLALSRSINVTTDTINLTSLAYHGPSLAADPAPPKLDVWTKALCRGQRLYQAMISDEAHADPFITPVRSPWSGRMMQGLYDWGYQDNSFNPGGQHCNFEHHHGLGEAFQSLGFDPRSESEGGPNSCFRIDHWNGIKGSWNEGQGEQYYYGPDGRTYQATGAHYSIGVNRESGILYMISVDLPLHSARELWQRQPRPEELPALRSNSDIAFGFWNRAHEGRDSSKIKMIMSIFVINVESERIIEEAMQGIFKDHRPGVWPGTIFLVNGDDDAGLALLGSPNGMSAGYFLAQHKNHFGQTKVIDKIQLFSVYGYMAMMMMWVADKPAPDPYEDEDDGMTLPPYGMSDSRLRSREWLEKNHLLREHIVNV